MAVNFEQSLAVLKKSNKIGVILPSEISIDAWAAACALSFWGASNNKEIQVISEAKSVPPLHFLGNLPVIQSGFSASDQFLIKVSTSNSSLKELSYNLEPNGIVINLKSENGLFSPEDVSFASSTQNYDAFVLLGVKNLDSLGKLYTDNADLFFNTLKLNLDINPSNEYFGTINVVDILATSLCELLSPLLTNNEQTQEDISQPLATSLLAGIIAQTHSFRDPKTSPKTLNIAARLVEQGAKQPEIIQHLYKTKNFSLLKLWGRALARIVSVPELKALHTTLTNIDFEKTGETINALPSVMKDILENVNNYNLAVLAAENGQTTSLLIAGLPHIPLQNILGELKLPQSEPTALIGSYEFVLLHNLSVRPDHLIESVMSSVTKTLNS